MTPHTCMSCTPGPNRVLDHERGVLNVPRGFRGPPASVHGGAVAGLIACLGDAHLAGPTARFNVRLHTPPPLETDLPYRLSPAPGSAGEGQRLGFEVAGPDGGVVLSGWVATALGAADEPAPVVPPEIVTDLAAHVALTPAERHHFDTRPDVLTEAFGECFGCGPHNSHGLRIRPRAIDDRRGWSEWVPEPRWHDHVGGGGGGGGGGGLATLPAIAALDCSSSIPFKELGVTTEDESVLLGTYDAEIHRRPPAVPEPGPDGTTSYRIVTAPRERQGRKIWADIGLFGPSGEVYITGCATWITVPLASVGG